MRKLTSRRGLCLGFSVAVALLAGSTARAQYPYSATPNAFGGQNFSGPGGQSFSTSRNVFGGQNYSNGGYTTPRASGGYNFWGR